MSVGSPSPATPAVPLRHRLSVEKLAGGQLGHIRDAFARAEQIADDRGYEHFAGLHGLPLPMYCKHGSPLFLPWHRAYLYMFELALRDRVPERPGWALPWWDWTSSGSHRHGIPSAYADKRAGGHENPLHSAPVDPKALQQGHANGLDVGPITQRRPANPSELPSASDVESVLSLPHFLDFSAQLEDIHNAVHGWVGGHMGEIPFAAFDPLFWAHHVMIDRVWRLWQLRHPGAGVPAALTQRALDPFPLRVSQVLDVTALGYDYASVTSHP
jgi:tyrosinase